MYELVFNDIIFSNKLLTIRPTPGLVSKMCGLFCE